MGKTRSKNRKKKLDDAMSKNTIKTCDDNSGTTCPWSDLNHDVLNLVMIKLQAVDFIAFSKVCKLWRSLTISNGNKFLVPKPPMSISISFNDAFEKECYLEDFEGRKLKTIVPDLANRTCLGITCGYLILFDKKSREFWLVNPIIRRELHFPNCPIEFSFHTSYYRGLLVFSPSRSEWVFVVFNRWLINSLWFCIAGKQEWTKVATHGLDDLIAFKGKIYALKTAYFGSDELTLYELKLYPEPQLVLLIRNPKSGFQYPVFASCGENLYVIDGWASNNLRKIHKLDIDEMKGVSIINTREKYAFFLHDNFPEHSLYRYTLREVRADIHSQYGRYVVRDVTGKFLLFHEKLWYFFDDCLNINLIHE
ncbi:hypothetical protein LXL04_038149 [Taraxacum kok-saghyz]